MKQRNGFERRVSDVIEGLGYRPVHQIGPEGFRIDIAVSHPERSGFIAAIILDGENYHAIESEFDRDFLFRRVLENQAWPKVHMIWIEKWYFDEQLEIDRLEEALEEAFMMTEDGPVINGANA